MNVQIFGSKKSAATRKAQRFFAERRIPVQFVDLKVRSASPGELKRFAQKFGVQALVDRDSPRFADLGLQHAQLTEERWLQKLVDEPMLLKLPLVRNRQQVTIGVTEDQWKEWVEAQ